LWAFDSFQSLPSSDDPRDSHPLWTKGNFASSLASFLDQCKTEGIPRDRFEVVKGFYSHTLSPESPGYERLPKDAALVYVDRDLYTSTKAVIDFLTPRLKHGMIVAFDDDFCASADAIAGERLAFLKLQKAMPRFRFLP
jgi:hypothetical protein